MTTFNARGEGDRATRTEVRFLCRCEPVTWLAPRSPRREPGWLRDISRRGMGLMVRGDMKIHRVGLSLVILDPDSQQPRRYRIVRRDFVDGVLYRLGCELQRPEDHGLGKPALPVPAPPTLAVRLRARQTAA